MIRLIVATCLALFALTAPARAQEQGRFVETDIIAKAPIGKTHVTIWLPPGYDATRRRYGVVYMHDGQNLFFLEKSGYNKIWAADKSALRLITAGKIAPVIIVGIDNPGKDRYRQYFPQALYHAAPPALRAVFDKGAQGPMMGDAYLRFITGELKPLIDRTYRTRRDAAHTALVGSSMGGLISCYGFSLYPRVFGRAACISTHWLLTMPENLPKDANILGMWDDFLARNLSKPAGRRLWMDYGTETLDAYYAPWQKHIDATLVRLGWVKGRDFESREYKGAPHDENAWAARMDDVFAWLLK